MQNISSLRCILFDLDGTLLDTAPDLIWALNTVLGDEGFEPINAAKIKPLISKGAVGMMQYSLGERSRDVNCSQMVDNMVDIYQQHIADNTQLFEGMETVLYALEQRGLKWGIVTNKRARFTEPLLQALNLFDRPGCIISGDTTNNSKPHPEPMLEACKRIKSKPAECIYIGDAERDIEAGIRAGMSTLAATYGYLADDDTPEAWGACGLLHTPTDILQWI